MAESVLKGKTLVALGDSLIHGNKLGNTVTWPNLLGEKHSMTVYNFGKNGNAIAKQERDAQVPMCVRYTDMPDGADYVVVLGGANDRRLCVPIGNDDDADISTFKGALNTLIPGIIKKYPHAKILFMTNYNRYPSPNRETGLADIEYVVAMQETCAKYGVPCYDNYHESGVSFTDPEMLAWIDEGISLGGDKNCHFSAEGYRWLLPKYEALLESL